MRNKLIPAQHGANTGAKKTRRERRQNYGSHQHHRQKSCGDTNLKIYVENQVRDHLSMYSTSVDLKTYKKNKMYIYQHRSFSATSATNPLIFFFKLCK